MAKQSITAIILILIISALLCAHPGKIVKKFPLKHTFPTGLTFDGKHLWLADYKADKLFMIEPDSGQVVRSIPSPGFWPMGLAWDGKHLWNVDGKQNMIFKVDPENGAILEAIEAPSSNPEGLTWDGKTLWVSDQRANLIMKIDLSDGTAVKKIDGPARSVQGLTFDGRHLCSSDRLTDEIYMIDPQSGEVIIIIEAPHKYPRGLAWDGNHLWNVDYQSDSLYQIISRDDEPYVLKNTRKAKVTFTHEVKISGPGKMLNLDTYIAIPWDMNQQKIGTKIFSPVDYKLEKDRWNQSVAAFNYRNTGSDSVLKSLIIVEADISEIQYFIFPDRCGTLKDIPKDIRELYTADGGKYLLSEKYIQDLSKKIVGDEQNPYWIARKIFDYVRKNLEYKLEGGWNVAPVVLERGTGSCSEYTFSFIALARAAGLPARYVGAIVVRGDDASLDEVFHRWPEIYLPNYGWIPIDPQGGDKAAPRDRIRNIGSLSNRFLITTQGGGDSEYLGWYYNYNQKYRTEPKVKVHIETFGEWEPLE